ncbi:SMI1/KNR4 family protein [Streptomyces roseicoloratus]|uniref:SMI1/KNR4 family protein n=1 Tax=Streptomyces roseicoloratus TaxID=2508722 RepID=A0ABY9RUA8_9ACTN|nr:SMI1/KNR4 family protein [Streptomyces roseicoloratus]WMX45771.1 SMI1/KNR4 family protein [Streptomyces roseicoloratus]
MTDWNAEYRRLLSGHRTHTAIPGSWDPPAVPSPPLGEAEVREAEAGLGITFPGEYRDHLLRGGAGRRIKPLWRGPQGWGWYGDSDTNYELLTEPFPHPDSYAAYGDELDDREPPREDQEAWQAWDDECGVLQERMTAGAVYLQEGGCGFHTLLVVSGPHRGEMWFDSRATCDRILPLRLRGRPVTFADWVDHGMNLVPW